MRRKKKRWIQLRKVYFTAIGAVFLISLVVSWLGSSKEEPSTHSTSGRPVGYKSGLDAVMEVDKYIEENNPSGGELQQLKDKQNNFGKIARYELYLPFTAPYRNAQNDLLVNPELTSLHDELINFSMPVWAKLSEAINEPTEANMQDLSRYMYSLKPDISNLIRKVEHAPNTLDPKVQEQIVRCLNKLLEVIDKERESGTRSRL
jgi:hypothetical protein